MQQKRSIQDIIPPARSRPIRAQPAPAPAPRPLPLKPRPTRIPGLGLIGITLSVIILIGAAFGIVSFVFHKAEITITPHAFSVTVAESFDASADGEFLSFSTISFEHTATRLVASTGSEKVEDRASGTITILNASTKEPQRLITNTRFESESGLIFRIKSPVTVPGYTVSGGTVTPGSATATVYADEPGERYNLPAGSFTIPGLLGSPQFEKITARSSAPFSGGFVGERAVVEKNVRDAAVAELTAEADRAARTGLSARIAENEDSLLIADSITVEFLDIPDRAEGEGALVAVKALAQAPVFSESQVAKLIAAEGGVVFDEPLTINNPADLSFSVTDAEENASKKLTISGSAELVAFIDTDSFIQKILGLNEREVGAILATYPGIRDLSLSVYPFWRQTLPMTPARFSVTLEE